MEPYDAICQAGYVAVTGRLAVNSIYFASGPRL